VEEEAMPLYEYRCAICGTQEEKLQPVSAPENHDCPECEAPAGMRRQLSVAAFSLSGGGWYKEGYGGAAEKKEAAVEGGVEKPADKPSAPAASEKPTAAAPQTGGGCACH
jgi:putative FmdB family regulatory protein